MRQRNAQMLVNQPGSDFNLKNFLKIYFHFILQAWKVRDKEINLPYIGSFNAGKSQVWAKLKPGPTTQSGLPHGVARVYWGLHLLSPRVDDKQRAWESTRHSAFRCGHLNRQLDYCSTHLPSPEFAFKSEARRGTLLLNYRNRNREEGGAAVVGTTFCSKPEKIRLYNLL